MERGDRTPALQWTTPTGYYMGDLVRGGNVIWIFEEYFDASGKDGDRIPGFAAGATSHTPLGSFR